MLSFLINYLPEDRQKINIFNMESIRSLEKDGYSSQITDDPNQYVFLPQQGLEEQLSGEGLF